MSVVGHRRRFRQGTVRLLRLDEDHQHQAFGVRDLLGGPHHEVNRALVAVELHGRRPGPDGALLREGLVERRAECPPKLGPHDFQDVFVGRANRVLQVPAGALR